MLRSLLVRAQIEMRKMLLEAGGKRILAVQWQKTQENVVWELFGNYELEYLAEEISKKSFEGVGKFLFPVTRERNRLWEKLLSKKELTLDSLRNSQSIQIAKDGKIRRFTDQKV